MVSLALLAAAAAVVAALAWALRRRRRLAPPRYERARRGGGAVYVPFRQAVTADALVVDCTHPSLPTLTHHKAHRNPPAALVAPADTSTALALNALAAAAAGTDLSAWLGRRAFAANHFDADALFPCFALADPAAAARHAPLLRAAAELSDFRSGLAAMGADAACAPGAPPAALALAAWVNSVEQRRFTPPYEDHDSDAKFAYFLKELPRFLEDPGARRAEWAEEAARVLDDWRALRSVPPADAPRLHADVGLAVVRAPRPLHYYALFSAEPAADAVLAIYPDGRYELEQRYTQFVAVWSRPVHARLELGPLADALNEVDVGRAPGAAWGAPRATDTGPLLRLDAAGARLPKKARYGHPTEREILRSGLSAAEVEAAALSYFRHGLAGAAPRVGGFSWDEQHALNAGVDWAPWRAALPATLRAARAAAK